MAIEKVTISHHHKQRLQSLLARIEKETKQDVAGVLRQAAVWAIQSAAKATGPAKGSAFKATIRRNKYRYKPLVATQDYEGGQYWYVRRDTGKMFSTSKPITGRKKKKGLRNAKAIKSWSKKKKKFVLHPTKHTKLDKSDKAFLIPHAGAAKAGWQKALAAFGDQKDARKQTFSVPSNDLAGYYFDRSTGTHKKRRSRKPYYKKAGSTYDFYVQNLVKYTEKTSPFSATTAMIKTIRRLEGYWLRRMDGRLQQRANK